MLVRELNSRVSFVVPSMAAQNRSILPDLIRTARFLAVKLMGKNLLGLADRHYSKQSTSRTLLNGITNYSIVSGYLHESISIYL